MPQGTTENIFPVKMLKAEHHATVGCDPPSTQLSRQIQLNKNLES